MNSYLSYVLSKSNSNQEKALQIYLYLCTIIDEDIKIKECLSYVMESNLKEKNDIFLKVFRMLCEAGKNSILTCILKFIEGKTFFDCHEYDNMFKMLRNNGNLELIDQMAKHNDLSDDQIEIIVSIIINNKDILNAY